MSDERPRTAPVERFAKDALAFDLGAEAAALRAEQTPGRHGHRQKTLFKHGGGTVALFVMDSGASLPEHAAAGTVTVHALEGELSVAIAGERRSLRPGDLVIISPGVRHDVRAHAAATFLLQVSLERTIGEH